MSAKKPGYGSAGACASSPPAGGGAGASPSGCSAHMVGSMRDRRAARTAARRRHRVRGAELGEARRAGVVTKAAIVGVASGIGGGSGSAEAEEGGRGRQCRGAGDG